ncbi:collagen alpha-1(I) chain-like [Poecile atricapillus]|uniref:collagen alpha-1(I) chain-like n=1 Tax=Poecile atricapillus TaxID=48891 RepID=UPI002739F346|nr:collagen alpha-1(I) chain-like [Poecile atricapillus]
MGHRTPPGPGVGGFSPPFPSSPREPIRSVRQKGLPPTGRNGSRGAETPHTQKSTARQTPTLCPPHAYKSERKRSGDPFATQPAGPRWLGPHRPRQLRKGRGAAASPAPYISLAGDIFPRRVRVRTRAGAGHRGRPPPLKQFRPQSAGPRLKAEEGGRGPQQLGARDGVPPPRPRDSRRATSPVTEPLERQKAGQSRRQGRAPHRASPAAPFRHTALSHLATAGRERGTGRRQPRPTGQPGLRDSRGRAGAGGKASYGARTTTEAPPADVCPRLPATVPHRDRQPKKTAPRRGGPRLKAEHMRGTRRRRLARQPPAFGFSPPQGLPRLGDKGTPLKFASCPATGPGLSAGPGPGPGPGRTRPPGDARLPAPGLDLLASPGPGPGPGPGPRTALVSGWHRNASPGSKILGPSDFFSCLRGQTPPSRADGQPAARARPADALDRQRGVPTPRGAETRHQPASRTSGRTAGEWKQAEACGGTRLEAAGPPRHWTRIAGRGGGRAAACSCRLSGGPRRSSAPGPPRAGPARNRPSPPAPAAHRLLGFSPPPVGDACRAAPPCDVTLPGTAFRAFPAPLLGDSWGRRRWPRPTHAPGGSPSGRPLGTATTPAGAEERADGAAGSLRLSLRRRLPSRSPPAGPTEACRQTAAPLIEPAKQKARSEGGEGLRPIGESRSTHRTAARRLTAGQTSGRPTVYPAAEGRRPTKAPRVQQVYPVATSRRGRLACPWVPPQGPPAANGRRPPKAARVPLGLHPRGRQPPRAARVPLGATPEAAKGWAGAARSWRGQRVDFPRFHQRPRAGEGKPAARRRRRRRPRGQAPAPRIGPGTRAEGSRGPSRPAAGPLSARRGTRLPPPKDLGSAARSGPRTPRIGPGTRAEESAKARRGGGTTAPARAPAPPEPPVGPGPAAERGLGGGGGGGGREEAPRTRATPLPGRRRRRTGLRPVGRARKRQKLVAGCPTIVRYAAGERRRRIRPPLRAPTTSGAPHRARPPERAGGRLSRAHRGSGGAAVYRPSQTPHLPLSPERVAAGARRPLGARSESPPRGSPPRLTGSKPAARRRPRRGAGPGTPPGDPPPREPRGPTPAARGLPRARRPRRPTARRGNPAGGEADGAAAPGPDDGDGGDGGRRCWGAGRGKAEGGRRGGRAAPAAAGAIHGKGPARVQSRRRARARAPPPARPGRAAAESALTRARRLVQPRRAPSPASRPSPTDPALRANPYPEVTDPACRLPLPTLFQHARGCSPWRPAADMGTARRETYTLSPGFSRASESSPDAAGTATLSKARAPLSGRTHSRAPGPSQRKENSPRGSRRLLRDRLRRRTGRLAAPVSATPDSGI